MRTVWSLLMVLLAILLCATVEAQTNYRSNVATGNWNAPGSWQSYNGSNWVTATTYPGQGSTGTVTIRDGHTITINVSPANTIASLVVGEGASGSLATNNTNYTMTATALTCTANSSFNLRRLSLTVNGTSTINGTVTDNNDNGTITFVGLVTVGSTGSISTSNASTFNFRGGIANSGTIDLTGANDVNFTTNSQTISGSGTITMDGAITVTTIVVTNNSTDVNMTGTAAGTLSGNGTWRQGTNGVLKYSGSTITVTTVDFNTNLNNTVDYANAGAQTIRNTTYRNLSVSGSGTKTLSAATTVNGNIDIAGSATLACDIYQITGNATGTLTMASGTTLALGRTSSGTNVAFPTNFTNSNITLNSGSTVAYQSSGAQTVSITPTYGGLSCLTGNTKTAAGNLTVTGNLIVTAATLNLGTTATTLDVSGTTAISGGGNLTFNGTTTKTVTLIGSLSGNGTINMSGGSLLHNLVLGGASNAIGTFTTAAVASTVTYNRAGAQGVFGSANYRNLTTSGSGTKSMSAAVTVANTFTIGTGTTFDPAGASLTASGNSVIAGTFAESNTGGTNNFQSVDLSGGTINGSVTDVTNIAGNLTMPTGNGTIGQTTLTVSGTTTIATGRSLSLNSNNGVKTFVGKVTVDGSGSWNSTTITTANNLIFRGGLEVTTVSGSFQTGVVTFNTNSQSITGAGPFTFGGAVTITGAITVTNTNTNGLTFNNTINGSAGGSTYRNGANGVTYYQPNATTQPMNTGTLDVSPNGNFFYYSRAGAQNIKVPSSNYYHLYLTGGGSAVKTLQGATDVDGDFMLAASTNFDPAANDFTVLGTSTIAGVFADASATGTSTLDDVDLSGGTIDGSATGVINIGGNLTMPSGTGTIGRVTLTTTGTTVIATGRTLTFNTNSNTGVKTFVGVITINGTGTWTSSNVSTGTNMILRGGINVVDAGGSFAGGAVTFNTNSQSLTGAGPITFANPVAITGAIVVTNTNTNGITFNNTIDGSVGGSTWRNGANGITYYQPAATTQPMNTGTLDMSANGNYFYYSRAGAQNIKVPATSYYNLNVTGGGSALKSLQGATSVSNDFTLAASTNFDPGANTFTVSGTSYIGGVYIDGNAGGNSNLNHVDLSGGTIDNAAVTGVVNIGGNLTMPSSDGIIGRVTLTTTGTTTIATGRTLTFNANSNTGVKTFIGAITINGTGIWTSANVSTGSNMIIRNGIDVVNSGGSFAAGAVTFNTNNQTLTGAGTISFANPVSITGAITVTNTNTNGITFTNTLDGTVAGSTWRNGAGGVTYYQPGAATQPMNTGALDMSATGNYFHYSRAGAQTIKVPATTYYHLTLSGSGAKTLQANTTLSGNLSVDASTSIDVATYSITVGGTTALNGTFTDGSTNGTNTFTGMLTVGATGNLSTSFNSPFVFEGGITNNGTFNQTGTGAVAFNTNNQDIDGTAVMAFAGDITIEANRTVTYKNTVAGGVTLTGVLNGANASSTWKNDVNSTVYYRPVVNTQPMVTGILDVSASGNNFHYSRVGTQTLKMPTGGYYNLIIDGGSSVTKVLGGNTIVNGTLTISAATTLDVDAAQSYSLNVKGDWLNSGTFQARTGTVTFSGTATQSVTTNSNSFYNLTMANTGDGISLNDNLTVTNTLTLSDGVITTGANRVTVTSSTPAAVTGHSSASFVNGNLRRQFATNTGTYGFPVGNGTAANNYFLAEILNHSLTGITYINAHFKPLTNHNDSEMSVADGWEDGSVTYTSMNTAGVWELEPNTAPGGGAYSVKLYVANMPGVVDNEFAVLKRPVGSVSGAAWTTGGGRLNPNDAPGRTVVDGYAKRSGLTGFSEFGIGHGSGAGVGLPIELLSFTAMVEDRVVKLDWLTATEINNDYFTIERSQDGQTFEPLAAFEGAGNSSVTNAYQTYDRKPFTGTSYYRLKQTDFDGASTYSEVVSVTIEDQETAFRIYPNPVTHGEFFIDLENQHDDNSGFIELINAVGLKVYSQSFSTNGKDRLRIGLPATIASGFYFVAVELDGKRYTRQVAIGSTQF